MATSSRLLTWADGDNFDSLSEKATRGPMKNVFHCMDPEGKERADSSKQGAHSTASAPIDKLTDNAREQKTAKLTEEQAGKHDAGQRQHEKGEGEQHSMSKRGDSESGNVNDAKESVGGPTTPGKPPERTPDKPRDSQAKV